jgi:hypothetical protein
MPTLYEFRWRWMTHRRSLGRSTGTRMSRGFACWLAVEGVVIGFGVIAGLTWALGRKW